VTNISNTLSLDLFVAGPHWGRANEKRSVSCHIRAIHYGLKGRRSRTLSWKVSSLTIIIIIGIPFLLKLVSSLSFH